MSAYGLKNYNSTVIYYVRRYRAGVILISKACSVLLLCACTILNLVSELLLPSLSPFFNSENFVPYSRWVGTYMNWSKLKQEQNMGTRDLYHSTALVEKFGILQCKRTWQSIVLETLAKVYGTWRIPLMRLHLQCLKFTWSRKSWALEYGEGASWLK